MTPLAIATPAAVGLALSLLCTAVYADKDEDTKLDLRRLTFHPAPLPEQQAATNAPPHLYLNVSASPTPQDNVYISATAMDAVFLRALEETPARIARYQQLISDLQVRDGMYSPALSEAYETLAKLQREQGDVEASLESLQSAQHVVRASAGLYSPDQIPLLRQMIATNLELGRIPAAHDLQSALLNLQQRHHGRDDLSFVPALTEWADWNVRLYLSQGTSGTFEINPATGSLSYRNPLLQEAHQRYVHALQILQQKETGSDDSRLVDVERKLAALNFMVSRETAHPVSTTPGSMFAPPGSAAAAELAMARSSTLHFLSGRSALERAVAYGYVVETPDYDTIAARMMELGDWYLLFDRRADALETYQEAMSILEEADVAPEEAERIIAAGLPIQPPDEKYFDAPPPRDFAGHIDVAFDLNRYGTASNTEIISSSAADPRIERELLRTIRAGKFRPKFKDGAVVDKDRVQLRYYYAVAGL